MIDAGLPVVSVENTSLACMRIDPKDERVQKLIPARYSLPAGEQSQ
jgi:hypothetical protein